MTDAVQDLVERIASASTTELFGAIQEQFSRIQSMPEAEAISFFRTMYLLGELTQNRDSKLLVLRFSQAAWDRLRAIRGGMQYEYIAHGCGGEIDQILARYSATA